MYTKLVALLILALVAARSAAPAAEAPSVLATCPVAEEFAVPDEPLAAVAAALAAGGPVNILAVGSATTVGVVPDRSHPDRAPIESFPYRMVEALQAAMPQVTFNLTVRGGKGMTAEDMVPLITSALAARHYAVVIWQTGTVEAVRGLSPDRLESALEDGVQRVQEAGGYVVLVDPQFSRFLRANTDIDPYERAIAAAAELPGANLFRRFDLMHSWAEDGTLDLERTAAAEQSAVVSLLNRCVGRALARFVRNGVGR